MLFGLASGRAAGWLLLTATFVLSLPFNGNSGNQQATFPRYESCVTDRSWFSIIANPPFACWPARVAFLMAVLVETASSLCNLLDMAIFRPNTTILVVLL